MKGFLLCNIFHGLVALCSPQLTPFSQDLYDSTDGPMKNWRTSSFIWVTILYFYKRGQQWKLATVDDGKTQTNEENTGGRTHCDKPRILLRIFCELFFFS